MIYLDTSAAAKLVHAEPESGALAVFLTERIGTPLVSSALLYPELIRAVMRHQPGLAARATILLQRVMTAPVSADVLTDAATIGNPGLRTLDAIHLATAAALSQEVTSFVTYDRRLAEAAAGIGLAVDAPA